MARAHPWIKMISRLPVSEIRHRGSYRGHAQLGQAILRAGERLAAIDSPLRDVAWHSRGSRIG